jgi:zinc transport system substrate-binding protein
LRARSSTSSVLYLIVRLILILGVALLGASCAAGAEEGSDARAVVVAGLYPLAYAAEEIGGDQVEVVNLTPPGAEPHDAELSVRDVERVRSADLVFYLGSGFQPSLEQAAAGAGGRKVDLLQGVAARNDPHVWLDPLRYEAVATRIGEVLARPAQARAFGRRLRRLDAELEAGLETCARRTIVTSHAAFGYLAERYGLEQIAITGLSPEAEPSPQDLVRVVAKIREHEATTVFSESLLSPRLAEAVARETGAKTAVLNPIEGLTEAELARGEDYFSLMRANLEALRKALGCR